jgi:hypothetical protein
VTIGHRDGPPEVSAEEFAERNRAAAAENARRILRAVVAAGDAGVRPGKELCELTGLSPRTARNGLRRLAARGLVHREGKRCVRATAAGRSEAGAGTPGLALVAALEPAFECLPAETLRAFARLQFAAVVARWHLASAYADDWGGFAAVGHTKSLKTTIARLVCHAFGLDELRAIRTLRYETHGSILGRRIPDRRSATGYRLAPSPQLDLPYLCLDELGRASPEVKAAAGALLLGTTRVELEGEVRTIRPLIYTTLNPHRGGLRELDDAYIRRSVVIDTTPLRDLLVDADLAAARLFDASGRIPRLFLEGLKPPLSELPADLWRLLRDELRRGLTEEGWALTDTEPLARVVLGHAAFTRGDLEQDVLAVAFDALCCASTLGHTVAGYMDPLVSRLGGGVMVPDPDAVDHERQLVVRRLGRELERAKDRDRLVEDRGRLAQMLEEALDRLDLRRLKDCSPQQRVDARGIAQRLREIRGCVTSASTREALTAAEARGREPLVRTGELLRQIDRERQARREIQTWAAPTQRSRRPELQPARKAIQLIIDMLPNANGSELDQLRQQAQQLEHAPPISETERRRRLEAFQREQVEIAERLNRHLLG